MYPWVWTLVWWQSSILATTPTHHVTIHYFKIKYKLQVQNFLKIGELRKRYRTIWTIKYYFRLNQPILANATPWIQLCIQFWSVEFDKNVAFCILILCAKEHLWFHLFELKNEKKISLCKEQFFTFNFDRPNFIFL